MKKNLFFSEVNNDSTLRPLMLSPDSTKELTIFHAPLTKLVFQSQGIIYFEYLDDEPLRITNDELKKRVYKAINSSEGENLRKEKEISSEQHYQLESDELRILADINAQYESYPNTPKATNSYSKFFSEK